jgi:hypothetical protein
MGTFNVIWEIQLDADTPFEAARLARAIQQDDESLATGFTIINLEGEEEDSETFVDTEILYMCNGCHEHVLEEEKSIVDGDDYCNRCK